ncbi:hypothetical protein J3E72DRAFT_327400, partial [Bipolaris maydis]
MILIVICFAGATVSAMSFSITGVTPYQREPPQKNPQQRKTPFSRSYRGYIPHEKRNEPKTKQNKQQGTPLANGHTGRYRTTRPRIYPKLMEREMASPTAKRL